MYREGERERDRPVFSRARPGLRHARLAARGMDTNDILHSRNQNIIVSSQKWHMMAHDGPFWVDFTPG